MRYLLAALLALIVVLGAGSVALGLRAWGDYRRLQLARLDPTGERQYGPANAALPPPRADRPRVVFLGDSRVARWQPQPAAAGYEPLWRGRDGETTAELLLRLDRDALGVGARAAVLAAGINDLKSIGLWPERAAEIESQTLANLRAAVTRLRDAGLGVVVLSIVPPAEPPLTRRPVWSEATRQAVARVNAALPSLSATGVVVVDAAALLAATDNRPRPEYAADFLHLSPAGYAALNAPVEQAIARAVAESAAPATAATPTPPAAADRSVAAPAAPAPPILASPREP